MKVKPIQKYKRPAYPTRLETEAKPALLQDNLPPAWKYHTEIIAAVTFFLAINCRNADDLFSPNLQEDTPAIVAPIFVHGNGYGVTGCVMVNPPAFLSEEEALSIIRTELEESGLTMTHENVALQNVPVYHNKTYTYLNSEYVEIPGETRPLNTDLSNPNKKIALEFVSTEDDEAFREDENDNWIGSSVDTETMQQSAEELRKRVANSGKGVYFAALYDPAADIDGFNWETDDWREFEERKLAKSRQLLKEQVHDFVRWLKAQGVM